MNQREVFDRVRTHLLSQGRKSERRGLCAYRGQDGLRCAIGCLIDDEHYDRLLENLSISDPNVRLAVQRSGIPLEGQPDLDLLSRLQHVHDAHHPEHWAAELTKVEEWMCPANTWWVT